jgi:hypothetical protein
LNALKNAAGLGKNNRDDSDDSDGSGGAFK